jgi:two-component system, response regulator YesN
MLHIFRIIQVNHFQGFSVHLFFIIQIVVTFFSGITCLLAALYFVFMEKWHAGKERFFILFLLSFSLYLLGRPLQILFETADMNSASFVVNATRLLFFFVLSFPSLMLLSGSLSRILRAHRATFYFLTGSFMGIFYLAVNVLARLDFSYSISLAPLTHMNFTLTNISPPLLALCTSGVQAAAGLFIFIGSSAEAARRITRGKKGASSPAYDALSSGGIAVFGLSFFIGAYLRIWLIPYSAAVPCALIIGYGLIRDMRKSVYRAQQLMPILETEIQKALLFGVPLPGKITGLFSALGKSPSINTVIVAKFPENPNGTTFGGERIIEHVLEEHLGGESFILFPLRERTIGIAVSSGAAENETLPTLLKKIREQSRWESGSEISFGIGRSGTGPEDLTISCYDALSVLNDNTAEVQPGISGIRGKTGSVRAPGEYPQREKELFLEDIRQGDTASVRRSFSTYFEKLSAFACGLPEIMNLRLYELLGSAIDAAIKGGADVDVLQSADLRYYGRIADMKDFSQAETVFSETAEELAEIVFRSYHSKNREVVVRAKNYIMEHFTEPITVDDAANTVGLSRSYFLQLFKESGGITFSDYLTSLRISKAKELLLKTEKSITDIAFEVGFNDSNYFSKVFNDSMRVSPSKFRKSAGENV